MSLHAAIRTYFAALDEYQRAVTWESLRGAAKEARQERLFRDLEVAERELRKMAAVDPFSINPQQTTEPAR